MPEKPTYEELRIKIYKLEQVESERDKALEALQESEKKFREIQKLAHMGNWSWDVNSGKVEWSNEVFKIFRLDPKEFTPLIDSILALSPWSEDHQRDKELIKKAVDSREIGSYEQRFLRPDGSTGYYFSSFQGVYDDSGKLTLINGIVQDITDRKQLEAQLQQTQKMEAIGTLAGGIAHDFNNILSGIFGYSQLAQRNIENPVKASKHIKLVIKGAQRATELVGRILTFSRQSDDQKQPFKIYLEIKDALKLLRSSIPSTIDLKSYLDSKKMVLADPIKIHQVIMNLCTNAYHSMRKTGGCLTVSLTDVEISNSRFFMGRNCVPGDYIKLEVSDTGHGIDKKTLKRIFDPYFTTKMKGDGTGLGLALVQAIVKEHDGFLEVHSKLEKGTHFYLYFPVTREEIKEKIPEAEKTLKLTGNERIMIVDDEDHIRESYKEFIENYGYHVQTFSNGIEAFKTFQINPAKFDLIITDMTMPGLTGDKLASKILKIQPDIPIVLCTGFSENITQKKAIGLGIKQFVQKPILNQELMVLIRKILDKKDS